MFTPVGSLLKTLPRRSKTPDVVIALFVRRVFGESLAKLCGDLPVEILKKVAAVSFKSGILTVKAPHLVSAELSMRSRGLIGAINEKLGRKIVSKIRFRNY